MREGHAGQTLWAHAALLCGAILEGREGCRRLCFLWAFGPREAVVVDGCTAEAGKIPLLQCSSDAWEAFSGIGTCGRRVLASWAVP